MKVGRERTDEASKKKGGLGKCGLCFFELGRFPENRSLEFQYFPNFRNHKSPHRGHRDVVRHQKSNRTKNNNYINKLRSLFGSHIPIFLPIRAWGSSYVFRLSPR